MAERLEAEVQVGEAPLPAKLAAASSEMLDSIGTSAIPDHVKALIGRMMDGTEPPGVPLAIHQVNKFGPQHINVAVLRAAGFKGSEIAQITGYNQQLVYNVMSHPYGKRLVKELQMCNGTRVLDIKTRIEDYAGELLDKAFGLAMLEQDLDKVTKVTFGLLDRAGHIPKDSAKEAPATGQEIKATDSTMQRLARAMEGSRMVNEQVMPTWTPRRPPDESFEDQSGSASVGAEEDGGPSHGTESSIQSGSQASRRIA